MTDNADGDYLGYDVYADTLWARIQQALNTDGDSAAPLGDDPLVVGIFGEWGAGKSKLLSLIRVRADKHLKDLQANRKADEGFGLTVPVFFQPWKYEHEPHLHVPLVMHITAALKDALKAEIGVGVALVEAATEVATGVSKMSVVAGQAAKVAASIYPTLQKVVGALSVFGASITLPDELGDWLEDAADATAAIEDKLDKREEKNKQEAQEKAKRQIQHSNEGLYFYRINEYLTKLTRPGKDLKVKDDLQAGLVTANTRINFVIFIDDLDRCLPEKAVEVLELIKTVFNLESFAFVLALDEEVVERGIGHRYMAYNLAGKKPEMPITGFEYLEKIVHLPFRLPALTRAQALDYMRRYEAGLLEERAKALPEAQRAPWVASRIWLAERAMALPGRLGLSVVDAPLVAESGTSTEAGVQVSRIGMRPGADAALITCRFNLAHLVVNSFGAHVPRKMIRIIELLHQVLEILEKRGRLA
ncbi:MAG: KAP family NTPase, partial [Rhodoferax sp.]|nr:KAP family NTPase [Rhodoferax sp.]